MCEVEVGGSVDPVVTLVEMVELANIAGVMPSGRGGVLLIVPVGNTVVG